MALKENLLNALNINPVYKISAVSVTQTTIVE